MKKLTFPLLMVLVAAASGTAHAADTANNCRLKGGDVVPLPAAACAREGGMVLTEKAAAAVQLSSDPRVAAAQQALLAVLSQPVVDPYSHAKDPEGVDRQVKFDGCVMTTEENLHLDYGNLVSARNDFRIISTVDFRAIDAKAFRVVGEVGSKGGNLKAQAVSVAVRSGGSKPLTVSVLRVGEEGKTEKFTTPGLAPYWDAPREYLWMKDGYGYIWVDEQGYADTGLIRVLYLLGSKQDAATLLTALGDMRAACQAGR
jgi:hypothetical protein